MKCSLTKKAFLAAAGLLFAAQLNAQTSGTAAVQQAAGKNAISELSAANNLSGALQEAISQLQTLSSSGKVDGLNGVVETLTGLSLSVDNKTGVAHFQNLSNTRSAGAAGPARTTAVQGGERTTAVAGAKRTTVQQLSSKDVVAKLDGAISQLEKRNEGSLNGVIAGLNSIKNDYAGSSYSSLRNSIRQ